jgi:hypothetical protein
MKSRSTPFFEAKINVYFEKGWSVSYGVETGTKSSYASRPVFSA